MNSFFFFSSELLVNKILIVSIVVNKFFLIKKKKLLLLLQLIPVKVNYNYSSLYKASSLNLKIWWKMVSFFVFLRCCIFIRRSQGSRLSAIVRSDSSCFYWNGWMKIDHFNLQYRSIYATFKLLAQLSFGSALKME